VIAFRGSRKDTRKTEDVYVCKEGGKNQILLPSFFPERSTTL